MEKLIFAEANGRELNFTDKIFGISSKAQEMAKREGADKVINATIGALLDDRGNLIVFDAVDKAAARAQSRRFCCICASLRNP